MNEKKRVIVYSIFNMIILYLLYPINQQLMVLNDFFGDKYSILIYLVIYFIYIFLNVEIYFIFLKNGYLNSLVIWRYICLGSILGSIITLIALVLISTKYEFQSYPYLKYTIPFDIRELSNLQYLLKNIIYIIFVYELSEKIYKYKISKK